MSTTPRMGPEHRQNVGAPVGNTNALRHGLWRDVSKLDHRTAEGQAIRHAESVFASALGGTPSPQENSILRSLAIALWRLSILESLMVDEQRSDQPDPDRVDRWDAQYLRWSNHLREGLRMIGLTRRTPAVADASAYFRARALEIAQAKESQPATADDLQEPAETQEPAFYDTEESE